MKRSVPAAVILALTVLCMAQGEAGNQDAGKVRKPEKPRGKHVSVLTYNVNYAMPRGKEALKIIRESGADVIFLQETNRSWEKLLGPGLKKKYPHSLFRHPSAKRRAGGQAVFSKYKVREVKFMTSPIGWLPSWLVEVDTPAGKLQVLALHLKPLSTSKGIPGAGALKELMKAHRKEIEKFRKSLKSGAPALILGDLNEGASGDSLKWLKEKGFTDALREFDRDTPTWHWKFKGVPVQERLDHILYSNHLHCYEAKVVKKGGSDHSPVWAGLEKKSPASQTDK